MCPTYTASVSSADGQAHKALQAYPPTMRLYVCWGTWKRPTPRPLRRADTHPCGKAHGALLEAGHDPQVIRCFGWEALPGVFNLTPGRREVKRLTGEVTVPVLVTDDGEVVAGSQEIVAWAHAHPRQDVATSPRTA